MFSGCSRYSLHDFKYPVNGALHIAAAGVRLDTGPQDFKRLPQTIEDFSGLGLVGIGFQEAVPSLEDGRGSSESLLGKSGCHDPVMSRPAGMEPLGPGSFRQILHAARGHAPCDTHGTQQLVLIKLEQLAGSNGGPKNAAGARGMKATLIMGSGIHGFTDFGHDFIAQNRSGDELPAAYFQVVPQSQNRRENDGSGMQ